MKTAGVYEQLWQLSKIQILIEDGDLCAERAGYRFDFDYTVSAENAQGVNFRQSGSKLLLFTPRNWKLM